MKATPLSPEEVTAAVERMVRTVREQDDPEELKEYRKLFRKHVPFNLRGYVTAHMIKALLTDAAPAARRTVAARPATRTERPERSARAYRSSRPEREARAERRPRPRDTSAPPEGMRRLFVSVGRNRKLQPEELTELFSSKIAVQPSDFGAIRILDSYSFIEVPDQMAQNAIALLSGTNFKGRRITVDFARNQG